MARRPGLSLRRLERVVDGFPRLRLLVVGDAMLDEYLWGDVERVNPEAPVPVVHVKRQSTALGGAANVVRNVVAMGAECLLGGVIGDDAAGDRVVDLMKELGADPTGLIRVEGRPTTRKTRVEAQSQQILRVDHETDAPVPSAARRKLDAWIREAMQRSHGVVLEDYGKGVLAPASARHWMRMFRDAQMDVAVDPKSHLVAYRGASMVKPNVREVEALTGRRIRNRDDLAAAVAKLRRQLDGAAVVVTRDAQGMTVFDDDPQGVDAPVARSEVFDRQGAGDTCIAALALARLAGASLLEAAIVANAAAAVVVAKLGTASASPEEIRPLLPAALEAVRRR
jgi:D-beta-D-heptose 7-phosphate kinase/D-beta-D-heptose 1-phosphate adenosyltransferase